ncbi:unnamed protein product [Symbiodinium natans]|uniref:Uncharacterized protein n=1 Tax=Symbiodinium natans TaxID=878477 RepID=A0A812RVU0_9DINO|nr:unnamed protein product [Symbiodinium natans]
MWRRACWLSLGAAFAAGARLDSSAKSISRRSAPAHRSPSDYTARPRWCPQDIGIEVDGWNEEGRHIHVRSVVEPEQLNRMGGYKAWQKTKPKTGQHTAFYISCNLDVDRAFLFSQDLDKRGEGVWANMSEPHEIGHASELVYLMGQQDAEIVEFAWDTLILDRLLNGTIAVKDVTGLHNWESSLVPHTSESNASTCEQLVNLELTGTVTKSGEQQQVSKTVQVSPWLYTRSEGFRIFTKTNEAGEEMTYWLRCADGYPVLAKKETDGQVETRAFDMWHGWRRTVSVKEGERLHFLADASVTRPIESGQVQITLG